MRYTEVSVIITINSIFSTELRDETAQVFVSRLIFVILTSTTREGLTVRCKKYTIVFYGDCVNNARYKAETVVIKSLPDSAWGTAVPRTMAWRQIKRALAVHNILLLSARASRTIVTCYNYF